MWWLKHAPQRPSRYWNGSGLFNGPSTSPNHDFWRSAVDTRTERIRTLNDDLRHYLLGGLAVITPGVAALGQQAVERIVKTIAGFQCTGRSLSNCMLLLSF
jgi:hypothetical protein